MEGELLLTPKDLAILQWEYPLLDFSFGDDYPEEAKIMREALLAHAKPIIEKQERERIIKWVEENSECDIIAKHSMRIILEKDWQTQCKKEGG